MSNTPHHPIRRKLLALLCSLPWLSACQANSYHTGDPAEDTLRQRFRGIGVVLMVDAVEGAKMVGVTIYNDLRTPIFGRAVVSQKNRSYLVVGGARIPRTVTVKWRRNDKDFHVISRGRGIEYLGTLAGDYTVPVAERIPDSILDYIRENGGALRIKIMLKDDGILIGWDVEKSLPIPGCKPSYGEPCTALHYFLPGGDFQEAKIYNGKVVQKGWYIDKNGRKSETDY